MKTTAQRLTSAEIESHLGRCVGLSISHVWKGFGSALFVELGKLHPVHSHIRGKRRRLPDDQGELTIQMGFEWRVERVRSVAFGSANSERQIQNRCPSLVGHRIEAIRTEGRLPELTLALSGNRWLRTCTHWDGQPEWVLTFPEGGCISVERGNVCFIQAKDREANKTGGR